MEPSALQPQIPPAPPIPIPAICPVCHQPVFSNYYFCPNCGTKIHSIPLSTTVATQAWIYAFSILLPMICFIFITKWPAIKYAKSNDPKTKRIGAIAWALLILSTLATIWFVVVWTQETIQSSVSAINSTMSLY